MNASCTMQVVISGGKQSGINVFVVLSEIAFDVTSNCF